DEALHHRVQQRHARAALGRGGPPLAHALDVATRAEVAAGAGEDHDARGLVGLQLVEGGDQLAPHDQIERVAGLRTVQGDGGDGTRAFVEERLVTHRWSFPAWRRQPPATGWSTGAVRGRSSMVSERSAARPRMPQAIAKAAP